MMGSRIWRTHHRTIKHNGKQSPRILLRHTAKQIGLKAIEFEGYLRALILIKRGLSINEHVATQQNLLIHHISTSGVSLFPRPSRKEHLFTRTGHK